MSLAPGESLAHSHSLFCPLQKQSIFLPPCPACLPAAPAPLTHAQPTPWWHSPLLPPPTATLGFCAWFVFCSPSLGFFVTPLTLNTSYLLLSSPSALQMTASPAHSLHPTLLSEGGGFLSATVLLGFGSQGSLNHTSAEALISHGTACAHPSGKLFQPSGVRTGRSPTQPAWRLGLEGSNLGARAGSSAPSTSSDPASGAGAQPCRAPAGWSPAQALSSPSHTAPGPPALPLAQGCPHPMLGLWENCPQECSFMESCSEQLER